ncbi:MAG TPA: LysR family transcriptional regulator, partial [Stenotrophomonas sp.]|nr:LysR family transcriptional regulator [Stenotrophomonas sp.]
RALESDSARFDLPFCTRPEQPSPLLRNFLEAAAGA